MIGTEAVIGLLGLVVAVMFLQAIIGLASGISDLYSKLLAGHIIYLWSRQQADTISDTASTPAPTGAYSRIRDKHGHYRYAGLDPDQAQELDEDYQEERGNEPTEDEWKSLIRNV